MQVNHSTKRHCETVDFQVDKHASGLGDVTTSATLKYHDSFERHWVGPMCIVYVYIKKKMFAAKNVHAGPINLFPSLLLL